jgi:hypothetical protein
VAVAGDDDKKTARNKRFGGADPSEEAEKKKARAGRFGTTVESEAQKTKLDARAKRFASTPPVRRCWDLACHAPLTNRLAAASCGNHRGESCQIGAPQHTQRFSAGSAGKRGARDSSRASEPLPSPGGSTHACLLTSPGAASPLTSRTSPSKTARGLTPVWARVWRNGSRRCEPPLCGLRGEPFARGRFHSL